MVRRWSYINLINYKHPSDFNLVRKGSFDNNMNSMMYLRKEYALSTHIPRHKWARRKHLHNWIPLTNIMKDWAKVYRFYRKYTKFVNNQYFTKNTLVAFNLVTALNSIPCLHKSSEDIVAAPVTRKVLHYFSAVTNSRLRFFKNNSHLARTLISYNPTYWDIALLPEKPSFVPLFSDNLTSLIPYHSTPLTKRGDYVNTMLNVMAWPVAMTLLNIKSIHRILILLTLFRLH